MSIVSIFSGAFCRAEAVCGKVAESLGYRLIDDQALAAEASRRFSVAESRLLRALTGKPSVFNRFTHEKERSISQLKQVLADYLQGDELIINGFAALMAPGEVSHVLKVCLIAETEFRVKEALAEGASSPKEALAKIHSADEAAMLWADYISGRDPWDAALYDILIPLDKKSIEEAVELVGQSARKVMLQPTPASIQAARDLALAAKVEAALAGKGHHISVSAKDGVVTLTINRHVILLSRLEAELTAIAKTVDGVREVKVKVGPQFYQSDVYRRVNFDLPSKILLVDDEREFVETLSERLESRDLGSVVVYDGQEALAVAADDEPEVMVLDLRMPGLDGIEVLRRIKREHPKVEVIILTGHGSEADRQTCMELGAFAYLQKPVDIEVLVETLKQAYQAAMDKEGA